ncbi:MAG TPA: hypothetical protein VMF66_15605 [Candidatus Acidoferrum sp.]|nr:hypothetical protein [Candidatus Acidoferrum sp.]
MKRTALLFSTAVLIALFFVGSSFGQDAATRASTPSDPPTVPVTTIVTTLGPKFTPAPAISKDDIAVYSGKTRVNIASLEAARGAKAGMQLALLIDDDDSPTALGSHFSEIKSFIEAQPPTTEVGIYYAQAGAARAAAEFSADHKAVAKKLRLPLGKFAGASPSVYLSLKDLVDHWPHNDMRHEVVMIASGVDRLHPGLQDPYLDDAIEHVQKAHVIVNTIYTGGFRLAQSLFLQQNAWRNLSQVATDSGGQQFFQGFETPVDFLPIFHKLNIQFGNQYLLTADMPQPSKGKGQLEPIHIKTEQNSLHLSYQPQVWVLGPNSEPKPGS